VRDVGVLVELGGDAGWDGVHLDAGQLAPVDQLGRHEAVEEARADRRLGDFSALEACLDAPLPHPPDHGRTRIMGVRGGPPGLLPFLFGQQGPEFLMFLLPVLVCAGKDVEDAAPADELREDRLLLGSGLAALGLDRLERPDGPDVALVLLLLSAPVDRLGVLIRDQVVESSSGVS